VNVAVAYAAVADRYLNILRAQFSGIIAKGQKFCPRGVCCKSLYQAHGFLQSSRVDLALSVFKDPSRFLSKQFLNFSSSV
jgi:hypothetical protein